MRKTIRKWFWAWDFDKEEKWLNEMSSKGLQLCGVGFCRYVFEVGTPGEYTIRLELLSQAPTHAESIQYIDFVESTGAEYLGNIMRWVYFRKPKTAEGFDLYSDYDSRIGHLNRLLSLLCIVGVIELYCALMNLIPFVMQGYPSQLLGGSACLLLSLLIGYGVLRVRKQKKLLQKERILHE